MQHLRSILNRFRSKEETSPWVLDRSNYEPSVMESKAQVTLNVSGPEDLITQLQAGSPIDTEYTVLLPPGRNDEAAYTHACLEFLVQNDARPIYNPVVQAAITGELQFGSYSYWQPRNIEVNWDQFPQGVLKIRMRYPSEQKQKTKLR